MYVHIYLYVRFPIAKPGTSVPSLRFHVMDVKSPEEDEEDIRTISILKMDNIEVTSKLAEIFNACRPRFVL